MPAEELPWLIVAITGRALAASAVRGGHRVVVLDCFADRDTSAAAVACRPIVARNRLHFDRRSLFAAARTLAPAARTAGLVYGSGFEGRTGWLSRLASGREIVGNDSTVVAGIRDPRRFFPLLDRLGVGHPEVRYRRPADASGWLLKRPGGAGGVGVRRADATPAPRGAYFQRWLPGRLRSVLFLADGRRAQVVGFNRPWTAPAPGAPFLYGGAVGGVKLPAGTEADVRNRLDDLVAATGLRGLNGLDFLLRGARWFALELNPRPTATLDLYDLDWPRGLFDAHIRASRGSLPARIPHPAAARAHSIVRAPRVWSAPEIPGFPSWCSDLPRPGIRFGAGDPVCAVHASGPDPVSAMRQVRRRRAAVICFLRRGRRAAIG